MSVPFIGRDVNLGPICQHQLLMDVEDPTTPFMENKWVIVSSPNLREEQQRLSNDGSG